MLYSFKPRLFLIIAALTCCAGSGVQAQEERSKLTVETELGPGWQSRNDVQIPNDSFGDKFALDQISGSGPWLTARFNFLWDINEKHGVRILLAPLSFEESGLINSDIDFAGGNFQANQPTEARYKFNS